VESVWQEVEAKGMSALSHVWQLIAKRSLSCRLICPRAVHRKMVSRVVHKEVAPGVNDENKWYLVWFIKAPVAIDKKRGIWSGS